MISENPFKKDRHRIRHMIGPVEAPATPFWLTDEDDEEILSSLPGVLEHITDETQGKEDFGWIVTVFDNDFNTYEEVIMILMAATGCNAHEAYIEAWEIDKLGKCVVHHSSEDDCRMAGSIITEIGIEVEVSQA